MLRTIARTAMAAMTVRKAGEVIVMIVHESLYG